MIKKIESGIIGLGYVGLPLAVAFAKHFNVVGYDSDKERIAQLNAGNDKTKEVNRKELLKRTKLVFSSKKSDLNDTDIYIIAVPTPVNKSNKPDLSLLINACKLVSKSLKQNNIIILESTQYTLVQLKKLVFRFSKEAQNLLLIKIFIVVIHLKE